MSDNAPSMPLLIHEVLEEELSSFHASPSDQFIKYREKKTQIIQTLFAQLGADGRAAGQTGEPLPDNDEGKNAWLKKHHPAALEEKLLPELYELLHAQKHAALCLSGGGIRTATFALGVIQGLAERGLLKSFHFLSTVSGGGYIGSWLTAWIHRTGLVTVEQQLAEAARASINGARHSAAASNTSDNASDFTLPLQVEPAPLQHLRAYSNYLTPRLGLFSADTWTLVAMFLRNLAIMWLMMVPLLTAILLIPWQALDTLQNRWVQSFVKEHATFFWVAGCVLLSFAIGYIGLHRPSAGDRRASQSSFFLWCLLPMGLSTILLTLFARVAYRNGVPEENLSRYLLLGVLVNLLGWSAHLFGKKFRKQLNLTAVRDKLLEMLAVVFIGLIAGAIFWKTTSLVFGEPTAPTLLNSDLNVSRWDRWYVCFSSPLMLLLLLGAETLFVAMSSMLTRDEDREWWGRAGAWILLVMLGWILFSSLMLLSPAWVSAWLAKCMAAAGGISGFITLVFGFSAKTPGAAGGKNPDKETSSKLMQWVTKMAAPIFVVCLLLLFALGVDKLRTLIQQWFVNEQAWIDSWLKATSDFFNDPALLLTLAAMALLVSVAFAMSWFVNINKFSMHALYRNRLIRAYLGASNQARQPHPFTGFDPKDNLQMWKLWPQSTASLLSDVSLSDEEKKNLTEEVEVSNNAAQSHHQSRLFHVVNTALNLVSGGELAWQERKAASFTFSPLHAGSLTLGYRHSKFYSAVKTASGKNEAIKLGTAVTISGAAASPNMGYHSSPAVAFLMTLFNVRLGWWLGNTGNAGNGKPNKLGNLMTPPWQKSGPTLAIRPMIEEALGLTNRNKPWVYLSDGGHFENLGLYEMALRRCRYIVVSDGSCDPDHNFDDLGMAIRKIRIDLGIPIEFINGLKIRSRKQWEKDSDAVNPHCAYAKIRYTAVDKFEGAADGVLIYLKPALNSNVPEDVLTYARANQFFPHDPTLGDQFFSESQFESYRVLGLTSVRAIGKELLNVTLATRTKAVKGAERDQADPLETFVAGAQKYLSITDTL